MDKFKKLAIEYRKKKAWGLLASYDLHGCNPKTLRDAAAIKRFVKVLCKKIDVTTYGPCVLKDFGENENVAGFSMMQLIETSLVSAHFVNKTNRIFLDVFSCAYFDPKIIADYAKKFFGARDIRFNYLLRK